MKSCRCIEGCRKRFRTKKCGAESSDPNRHSQPRLPGSVVGEASMRWVGFCSKITKVSGPRLHRKVRAASKEQPGSALLVAHGSQLTKSICSWIPANA